MLSDLMMFAEQRSVNTDNNPNGVDHIIIITKREKHAKAF